MLITNAVMAHKENNFETKKCVVEKIIRLSKAEYDRFTRNMLHDYDFIKDNVELMRCDADGTRHCLLITGDGRRDGVLIESSGYPYARYSAFIPNVEGFMIAEKYPSLVVLNKRLADIADYIAKQAETGQNNGKSIIDLQYIDAVFEIDLMRNTALQSVVLNMLYEEQKIQDYEFDNNVLTVYPVPKNKELLDPSVTKTDMYAYGYGWDGMTPLGKERALELLDKWHEIYLLYDDGTEAMADSRVEIESFDGLFGVEYPAPGIWEKEPPFEVFILNRERYNKGEPIGEWLTLPSDADTMSGLLERIGIDRPSGNAYTVTAVRMPMYDILRDHISKYDSIDELNMLATYMDGLEDYELDKFKAILTSGILNLGNGIVDLTNLLDADNFEAFDLINAKNVYELGFYWDNQDPDNYPEDTTYSEYGSQIVEEEKGKFTEWGYIYCRYKELNQEYTGIVPVEYRIVGDALLSLYLRQHPVPVSKQPVFIEVYVLKLDKSGKGETAGEWLMLSTDSETLSGLFNRIGISGSYAEDYKLCGFHSSVQGLTYILNSNENLDELNMLATRLSVMDVEKLNKTKAILKMKLIDANEGAAALLNLLGPNNFDGFELIDAASAEALGQYWESRAPSYFPRGVTYEEYGALLFEKEVCFLTEWGCIYSNNFEIFQDYNGIIPHEYRISDKALLYTAQIISPDKSDNNKSDDNISVLDKIKEGQKTPYKPRKDKQKKDKGDIEL